VIRFTGVDPVQELWREKQKICPRDTHPAWIIEAAILTVKFATSAEIRVLPLYAKHMAVISPGVIVAILS